MAGATSNPSSRRRLLQWVLPAGAVLLAALAFISLYAGDSPPERQLSASESRPAAEPRFVGAYPSEAGADGRRWRWIGNSADLMVSGARGRRWLAFQAASWRRPRVLYVTTADQRQQFPIRTTSTAQWHIVGPTDLRGRMRLRLSVQPGAERGPGNDTRLLSVFLSSPAIAASPVYAAAAEGFWPVERESGTGVEFNWLERAGTVDIVAADPSEDSAWLTLRAQANIDQVLTVSEPGRPTPPNRFEIAGGSQGQELTVGPVSLRQGRGMLRLTASPGPRRASRRDARKVSVRVAGLRATRQKPN